jgi:3-dehydrosphinganine reductase
LYGYSAYGSAKFAVTGLSDSLRYELKEHGVQVSVVFPTDTKTPQLEFEIQHKPPVLKALTEANNTPVAPELVAKNILKNVRKGKYFILPTSDGALLYSVTRFFPGNGIYRVVDLLMAQARSKAAKENRR